jgi:hypothetical protein
MATPFSLGKSSGVQGYSRHSRAHRGRILAILKAKKKTRDGKKAEQKASPVATTQARADEDISTTKKSRKPSSTGQEQVEAAPGDLVPLVFCKYSTDGPQPAGVSVGGIWMQPAKIKQASHGFVGIFLYPLSQGEVVSTPVASLTYVGDKSLTARGGTIPTLTTYYRSVATMDAAKNVCPITSGKIFCHPDATSWIDHVQKKEGFIEAFPAFHTQYWNEFELTLGLGDTTNTVIKIPGTALRVFEVESGDDRTSNYWASAGAGITPATTTFIFNIKDSLLGQETAHDVGEIRHWSNSYCTVADASDCPGEWELPLDVEFPGFGWWDIFGSSSADKPVAWEYGQGTIDTTYRASGAATDETLGGVVIEYHISPVADPTNFDATHDFRDYADITFLEVQGDIYDESNRSEGEYKTTTRQLSVFIEQGAKVALYSAGTPGTTGASHHFVDLAMHLFTLNKRLAAGTTADIASPVDTSNLQALSTFHTNLGLFYNGIIEQSVNIIEFISTMSPFFFLSFVSENGRYAFKPLLPLTSGNQIDTTALTPAATFTDSNIIPGTFEKEYTEGEERRDVQISVLFMESKKFRVGIQKSTQIRYSSAANDARVIQYDMTDCCVTGRHARNFAKLQLATRKHSTHSIVFSTALLTSNLSVTDIIKVQRVRKNNVGDDRTEIDHYQITSLTHGTDGTSTIGAMHFPLNSSGVAKISDDVVNGSFTTLG